MNKDKDTKIPEKVKNDVVNFIRDRLRFREVPGLTDAEVYNDQFGVPIDFFLNTVKELEKKYRDEFGLNLKPTIEKVIFYFKEAGYKRNLVLNRIEDKQGKQITLENLYILLLRQDLKIQKEDLRALIASDAIETFHPLGEYLETIKDVDLLNIDWFAKLSEYIKTDDPEFFATMLKKHIIRTIDQYFRSIPNRYIFVGFGGQEKGKSAFFRYLNPLSIEYYSETPLRGDKDGEILLAKTLIYNIEELEGLSKTEVNKIKSFISRWLINERDPYAAQAVTRQRFAALFASTNDREFLTDVVNSRWIIVDVKSIDYNYHNLATGRIDVPINMLWAQAYREWQADNNSGQLTAEEKEKQAAINKLYEISSLEFHLILKHFKEPEADEIEAIEFLSSTDILLRLTEKYPSIKINAVWIGREMKRAGFKSRVSWVNNRAVRGYDLIFNSEGYGKIEKLPF